MRFLGTIKRSVGSQDCFFFKGLYTRRAPKFELQIQQSIPDHKQTQTPFPKCPSACRSAVHFPITFCQIPGKDLHGFNSTFSTVRINQQKKCPFIWTRWYICRALSRHLWMFNISHKVMARLTTVPFWGGNVVTSSCTQWWFPSGLHFLCVQCRPVSIRVSDSLQQKTAGAFVAPRC